MVTRKLVRRQGAKTFNSSNTLFSLFNVLQVFTSLGLVDKSARISLPPAINLFISLLLVLLAFGSGIQECKVDSGTSWVQKWEGEGHLHEGIQALHVGAHS